VTRRILLVLVSLAGAGLLLVAASAPALAHAVLVSTSPPDRAELTEPPDRVTITFNEPVEVATGALRVFDRDARRVDTGQLPTDDPATVAAGLPADLPDGGYVATYRVVSADSHPLAGVFAFTVGDAEAVDDRVVAELFGGAGDDLLGVVGPVLRGASYLATLLAAGALAFTALVARRDEDRVLARRVGSRAALVGVGVSLLAIPVQGAAIAGVGVWEAATSTTVLGEVIGSSFGDSSLLRITGLFALWALWRIETSPALIGIAAGAGLGSYVLDGHQRSFEPAWVLRGADIVHLGAAAFWFAGLVLLGLILRRGPGDPGRGGAVDVARTVARFSSLALVSVLLLTAAGAAMAVPLVGSPRALTSTTYGWLLVAKVVAVGAVVVLAVYNRQRLVPAVSALIPPAGASVDLPSGTEPARTLAAGSAWERLGVTMRVEAGVLAAVLVLTGFLVSQQPAAEAGGLGGLFETTAALTDDLQVDLVVDPNRAGRNTIHLYVLDATGRPSAEVEDLALELSFLPQDIGPIPVEPFFAGPGHWVATVDELAFAGEWEVRVVAGLDRFTEASATVRVPVAP
jgi:copper transport protein